jgi:predicted DNA-binding transcriptional regulator AlpA
VIAAPNQTRGRDIAQVVAFQTNLTRVGGATGWHFRCSQKCNLSGLRGYLIDLFVERCITTVVVAQLRFLSPADKRRACKLQKPLPLLGHQQQLEPEMSTISPEQPVANSYIQSDLYNPALDFGANTLDRMLTRAETARFLGISVPSLERWAGANIGPTFVKIGPRRVGYRMRDLLAYVDSRSAERAA